MADSWFFFQVPKSLFPQVSFSRRLTQIETASDSYRDPQIEIKNSEFQLNEVFIKLFVHSWLKNLSFSFDFSIEQETTNINIPCSQIIF